MTLKEMGEAHTVGASEPFWYKASCASGCVGVGLAGVYFSNHYTSTSCACAFDSPLRKM